MTPAPTESTANGAKGRPGTSAMTPSIPATIVIAFGWRIT